MRWRGRLQGLDESELRLAAQVGIAVGALRGTVPELSLDGLDRVPPGSRLGGDGVAPDLVMPELAEPKRFLDGRQDPGVSVDLLRPGPVLAEQELLARVAPLDVPLNRIPNVVWEGQHEDAIVLTRNELRRTIFESLRHGAIDDQLGWGVSNAVL